MANYTDDDKIKLFKNELEDIKDENLRAFAKDIILNAPDYFFTVAASSTGKYHPTLSLGEGGLIRHTRLVEWFAVNIANAMMIEEHNKDILIVAAITHDIKKHGNENSKYTVNEHPKLAAEYLKDVWEKNNNGVLKEDAEKIARIVECHMGQWGEKDGLPVPKTKLELILHTADYLASRKDISEFSFRPTEEVEKMEEPASEYRLTFGKYKGMTLGQFYEEDKDKAIDYYEWVVGNEEFKIVDAKEKMKLFLDEKKKDLQIS